MKKTVTQVPLPHLGVGIEEAELVVWHACEGDLVQKGDDLCEVVTDKVSFNVESPYSGVLGKSYVQENDVLKVGDPMVDVYLEKETDNERS